MGTLAYEEKYTIQDYREWEGDWELVYGDAYAMAPSPMYGHQYVNLKIARQLDEKLEACTECSAIIEMDWEVSDDTAVRPDSMVICYEPIERVTERPEIIFEVISPGTGKRDEILKFALYQSEGVPWYILAYPEKQEAKVYRLEDSTYQKIGNFADETFRFELDRCEIEFNFGFIWRRR
jgi:Uma2 family endonuclease